MSSDLVNSGANGPLPRIVDRFLEDRSIRWMLAAGLLIVLGSSVMLATSHWGDITPIWKYVVLVGATTGLAVAGHWCYDRLALHRTGSSLLALVVLLWPVTFLTLRWASQQPAAPPVEAIQLNDTPLQSSATVPPLESTSRGSSVLPLAGGARGGLDAMSFAGGLVFSLTNLLLLSLNLTLCRWSSKRIFRHFLREQQTTFELSYLLLSLAGAVLSLTPVAFVPIAALVLWFLFTAGSIKANRHVFWLTEEKRYPRIFGFFPILLLGTQFLGLFWLDLARGIAFEWLGLGCVLVAIPVFACADALANVFEQRTGGLVRPLPWSLLLPMGVAILLCLSGIAVAATGFAPPPRVYAMVMTTAGVAILMSLVAKRTQNVSFVWIAILAATMAYNLSPVFFKDLARAAVHGAAQTVHEPKLPYAFYGLTYLPWIAAMMTLAAVADRRGLDYFARPLAQFAKFLPVLLLAISVTHVKAILPVSLALLGLFVLQAVLLDRRQLFFAVAALILASIGFEPFLRMGLRYELPESTWMYACLVCAAVLATAGHWFEQWLELRNWKPRVSYAPLLCRRASLLVAIAVACLQLAQPARLVEVATDPLAITVIVALLVFHAGTSQRSSIALLAMLYVHAICIKCRLLAGLPMFDILDGIAVALLAQWLVGRLLKSWETHTPYSAFVVANRRLSDIGLTLVVVGYVLPVSVIAIRAALRMPELMPISLLPMLIVVSLFEIAWRRRDQVLALLSTFGILVAGSAVTLTSVTADPYRLPLLWAGLGLLSIEVVGRLVRRQLPLVRWSSIALPQDLLVPQTLLSLAWLVLTSVVFLGILLLNWWVQLAATIAVIGIFREAALSGRNSDRVQTAIAANWVLLSAVLHLTLPGNHVLVEILPRLPVVAIAVAALWMAASVLLWELFSSRVSNQAFPSFDLHVFALCLVGLTALMTCVGAGVASWLVVAMVLTAFAFLMLSEITRALMDQDEFRVWLAAVLCGGAGFYLLRTGILPLEAGISMFVLLALALFCSIFSRLTQLHPKLAVFHRPLTLSATMLPAATVLLAIGHHVYGSVPAWLGMNSLAVLLAAAFYYWRGLQRHEPAWIVLATIILNVAGVLLWRELSWSDPQFFAVPVGLSIIGLVTLLRNEIATAWHNPLRYLGALCILVSPTPHLVGGSWIHIFSLMVASVFIVLIGIGLRTRALMYTGTAFLIADLLAMVIRGSIDQPNLLWLFGLGFGISVVALAAACENRREYLSQRLRVVAAALETWD